MAYNTKKILRDRNGDPIPQSYDSDGDRYVPSEIDTRLKAIERQQTEILERLDKPIDTQLTGSNVEENVLIILKNEEIEPESYMDIKGEMFNNFNEFVRSNSFKVYARDYDKIIDASLYHVTRVNGGSTVTARIKISDVGDSGSINTVEKSVEEDVLPLVSDDNPYIESFFRVYNESNKQGKIDVIIVYS